MPSTYTSSLRLVKPATGELSNTWGTVFNASFSDLIDTAIAGYQAIAMTDADQTLTAANGSADQSRAMMTKFTGTLTAGRNIVVPNTSKLYFINNGTTGGFALTIKTSAGTGIAIPAGSSALVACDGTNVVDTITSIAGAVVLGSGLTVTGTVSGTGFSNYLASPPAIGGTAAAAGSFTTLSASSTVSGTGFSSYLASPPAIGGTAAAAVSSTNLAYTGTLTGGTGVVNIGSNQFYKDAAGNIGLGVVPSAWSAIKAVQVGQGAAFSGNASYPDAYMNSNAYYDGAAWRYLVSAQPALGFDARATSGSFVWSIAPAGTAGNPITFTQAMTLDANGQLGINTAPVAAQKLTVNGNTLLGGNNTGNGTLNYWPVTINDGYTAGGGTNQTFVRLGRFASGHAGIDAFQGGVGGSTLSLGSYGTEVLQITAAGVIQDAAGNELGYKDVPSNPQTAAYVATVADRSKSIDITTGGVTINNGVFSAGHTFAITNNSGTAQTITQGGTATLHLAGTTTTGNRTLAPWGQASIRCLGGDVFIVAGNVT